MDTQPRRNSRNCLVGALLFLLTVGVGVPLVFCGFACVGWFNRPPAGPLPDPGFLAEMSEDRPIPDLQRLRREYLAATSGRGVFVRMDPPGVYLLPRVTVGSGWPGLSAADRQNFLAVAFAYFHDGPDYANTGRAVFVIDARGNELASYSRVGGVRDHTRQPPTSARSPADQRTP